MSKVKKLSARYPSTKDLAKQTGFTIHQIRHWIKRRHENGLDQYVVTSGRMIFVNKEYFDKWVIKNKLKPSIRRKRRKSNQLHFQPGIGLIKQLPTEAEVSRATCCFIAKPAPTGFFRKIFNYLGL